MEILILSALLCLGPLRRLSCKDFLQKCYVYFPFPSSFIRVPSYVCKMNELKRRLRKLRTEYDLV
jgi:hypothetical protein